MHQGAVIFSSKRNIVRTSVDMSASMFSSCTWHQAVEINTHTCAVLHYFPSDVTHLFLIPVELYLNLKP